jgi:hypothetical protein
MTGQPSTGLEPVPDVEGLGRHVGTHGGESPYRICHESAVEVVLDTCRNQRKHTEGVTKVTRGTSGNDTHNESTTRQTRRKRSQSHNRGTEWTQYTVHSTAPTNEGMAVFNVQPVQSLRLPR